MGLKENLSEFHTRLSGSRVKKYDAELKHLNDVANRNGHEVYTKASKQMRGWSFMPKSEDYRWQQVHDDPKQQKIYTLMNTRQEKRKAASRDTNRARLLVGGGLLGAGALTAGGVMLAKKLKERKQNKEQEEMYYKEAADNSLSNPVITGLMQIRKNFAHAPELDHMYGGRLASRVKDIATGKRILEARRILKSNKDGVYTAIKDTKGNKTLNTLNKDIDVFNKANEAVKNIRREKEKYTPSRTANRDNLEHLLNLKAQGKRVSNSKSYQEALNQARKLSNEDETITRNATLVGKTIDSKFNNIKKTRDNEIAKTVALYGVPIAATAGGVMLYKKHKKKKESEDKNTQKK